MKVIAIIPARGGSKGIKNKNIISFCDKPLIAHTIEQAKNCSFIDDVYVTSDSKEILEISEKFGAKIIQRPSEISDDFSTSESALIHAIKQIPGEEEKIIIFLQATSPLRSSRDIEQAIIKFKQTNSDSLFSAVDAGDMCIWENNDKLSSITYNYNNRKRRQDFNSYIVENGSFYITKSSFLIKNNNRLSGKISFYIMEKWKIHEIDDIDDLQLCEYLFKNKFIRNNNEISGLCN